MPTRVRWMLFLVLAVAVCGAVVAGSWASATPAAAKPDAEGASADGDKPLVAPAIAPTLMLQGGGATSAAAAGSSHPAALELRGADDFAQLLLTLVSAEDAQDVTRTATYAVEPAGLARIEASGLITPTANGQGTITATLATGEVASLPLIVAHVGTELPVNFPNDVVPLFTRLGCNSGGCHGKASGQNGFRLSLLGFVPADDYEFLVKESRGRRVFPAAPDQSLLLLKSTGAVPHGGGVRLAADSYEYRTLRRWIAQGMPYGAASDPVVTGIEVIPAERTLPRKSEQQLAVLAHFSDGSLRDVTRMTQFESNSGEMAEVSKTGLVSTLDLTGSVAVMARYAGQVATFQANIPLGAEVAHWPAPRNFIDEAVFNRLRTLGIPPSELCDDATFLRRATIDLAGRLPTLAETEAFLADPNAQKRDELIERLLRSPDYADYFANKWGAILRVKRAGNSSVRANLTFHDWIRDSLLANKPYDVFVREILTASGAPDENPPVVWYKEVRTPEEEVEDVAQLFLGLRIQCAKCHHHPFEKWSQSDYYKFAAFFSRLGRKQDNVQGQERVFHRRGDAEAQIPKTGERFRPAGLDGPELQIAAESDPREDLADWLTDPRNPYFAKALVNRYWKHFLGAGIVDPEDDMRITNPPSNPDLLNALEAHFVDSGFDLKELVRAICQSRTYQLASDPNEWNAKDQQAHSRYLPARLNAEVLLDAIDELTGTQTQLAGLPPQMRSVQLPDSAGGTYFLSVFGRPEAESACECERTGEANLAQSLHLLNSGELTGKVNADTGRAHALAADDTRDDAAKIRELYLRAFSRPPTDAELDIATKYMLAHAAEKTLAYEDLVWSLLNTKEFLFNH